MEYKLPPLPTLPDAEVEEWSESGITFRGEGWKKETVEKYATAYAIAAIEAQASVVQQEPVAKIVSAGDAHGKVEWLVHSGRPIRIGQALYTHPAQQAKPQPLSDEQKDAVLSDVVDMLSKQHDWLTRTSAINLVVRLYGRAGSVLAHGIKGS